MLGERSAVGALLAVVAGCGAGGDTIPFAQLEPTALQATCRLEVLCGNYPDLATCESSEQTQPHYYDTIGADIASGKVVYDGAKARACIDDLNAISSCIGGFLDVELESAAGCTGIFTGKVAAGGSCHFSPECAGGAECGLSETSCDSLGQCCAGTCSATPVVVLEGGDCSSGGACAPGTFCSANTTTATCLAAPATVGASCAGSDSCAPPLYCSPTTQTCQQLPLTGEPCAPGAAIPSAQVSLCQNPLDTCDATSNVCVPLVGVGGSCDPSTGGCVSYAACDPATNTCLEAPAVGQPCDPNGAPCLGGMCDATTSRCTLAPTAGACS
jgi:hypothetical protein